MNTLINVATVRLLSMAAVVCMGVSPVLACPGVLNPAAEQTICRQPLIAHILQVQ
ncbi:hypothetical protein AB0F09_26925 [Streptomyces olivaceus]|uniref:hypothetical protein n=1 Tax=Streptomyces olivaceus TaxID=47716 RepID=UPI0033C59729